MRFFCLIFLFSSFVFSDSLTVPAMVSGSPAAGQRVKRVPSGDTVYYSLWLPSNYSPTGTKFPVVFESPANGYRVGTARFGYGFAYPNNCVWVVMNFMNDAGDTTSLWWGNGTPGNALTSYNSWKRVVRDVKANFNVDTNKFYLCGWSRGSVAVGAVGCYDDTIAGWWAGIMPFSHIDGSTYTTDANNVRANRIKHKKIMVTWGDSSDTGENDSRWGFYNFSDLCANVTGFSITHYAHNDYWILDNNKAETIRAREWFARCLRGDTSSCGY